MSTRLRIAVLGTAFAIFTGMNAGVWAALVPIVNPFFEDDLAPDGGFNPAKTGWGAPFDGFGVRASGSIDPSAADGGPAFAGENNWLQTQVSPSAGGPLGGTSFVGGSQAVPTTIMANTRYTLSAVVANDMRNAFPSIIDADDEYGPAFFNGGLPTTVFRLFKPDGLGFGQAAGVTLVSTSPIPVPGGQALWTRVYETNAAPANLGDPLTIQIFLQTNEPGDANGLGGGTREVLWDRIRLTTGPVPEPGSVLLLGSSGLILAAIRRCSRR